MSLEFGLASESRYLLIIAGVAGRQLIAPPSSRPSAGFLSRGHATASMHSGPLFFTLMSAVLSQQARVPRGADRAERVRPGALTPHDSALKDHRRRATALG